MSAISHVGMSVEISDAGVRIISPLSSKCISFSNLRLYQAHDFHNSRWYEFFMSMGTMALVDVEDSKGCFISSYCFHDADDMLGKIQQAQEVTLLPLYIQQCSSGGHISFDALKISQNSLIHVDRDRPLTTISAIDVSSDYLTIIGISNARAYIETVSLKHVCNVALLLRLLIRLGVNVRIEGSRLADEEKRGKSGKSVTL
jgi:hypothetical protein